MRRWFGVVCALAAAGSALGQVELAQWGAASSAAVRVDARPVALASGREALPTALGEVACDGVALAGGAWETAALPDGWHTLTAEAATNAVSVLTLNGPGVQVHGGRLGGDVRWAAESVQVVRHWVVVPSGVTLSVQAGTVVKFAEGSGLWVEDGGKLEVEAAEAGSYATFTALADDARGGDSDWRAGEGAGATWQLVLAPNATFADNGLLEARYGKSVPRWGSVSIGDAVTSELYETVRVPITVSGTRTEPLTVAWETADGTAVAGEDYGASAGRLTWQSGESTTKYAEIPILPDEASEETEHFKVRIVLAYGLNITRAEATVTLNNYDPAEGPFGALAHASGTSEAVRVDARETLGGRLAHGTVALSEVAGEVTCDGAAVAEGLWETAALADGLHTLAQAGQEARVTTLNTPAVHIAYGRLSEDTTWSAAQTHLVRNWVVIPKGVTLTVTAGSVVKFTPGSGIWIEDGGKLDVQGSAEELVVFTHSADNNLGEQVSFEAEAEATMNAYAIVKGPNATFTDNGWLAAKWLDVATFGRITLHPATTAVTAGAVRVPVTLSGTRNAPFVLRWVAEEGSAKLGEDYTLAAGELSWSGTSEGTKHIVIPILDNPENTERRSFKVRADIVCGMNVSPDPVEVTLYRNGLEAQLGAGSPFAWESRQSAAVRLDGRLDEAGAVASGSEAVHPWAGAACDGEALTSGAWETAALADAWHTLTLDDAARELLTLNDPGVRVVGGRLAEATQWTAEAVYVVRHWVVVPRGVTLQVAAGTVVKFLPGTGLWIEDGGTVEITGEAGQDVIFTDFEDDSAGGDTDRREPSEAPAQNRWQVKRAPSGTLKENGYWQVRGHTLGVNFATVAIQDALAREAQGEVWVPVTISGTRKAFFSLDWEAVSGTASVAEDLGETVSGTLAWSSTDQGTQFIRIPVVQDGVVEGCEQLTVRLTAVRGANASRREAAVTLYDSEPAADGEALAVSWESEGNQPTSPAATVRALQENFQDTLIVGGEQPFRYSPYWQAQTEDWRACTVEIACARTGAAEQRVLFRGDAGAEGEFLWRVQNLDDGELLLSHRIYGPDGTLRATTSRMLRYLSASELHSGVIGEDTVWQAGKVHLVYGDVTVASGVTLTIEPGAVVKFCDGTGLYGEDYTAVILGQGVTFTHFADDTCGGDTNLDGSRSQPNYGTYTLGGHIVTDEKTAFRCRQETNLSTIKSDTTRLESGNVYLVDKDLTFTSGQSLIVEPGVVVKFAANTSMTFQSGATLQAQGTRAEPIFFTSIKDDAHGGDTNEDGDATSPQAGDWHQVNVLGMASLDHVSFLYCSAKNNQGGLFVGGTVEARNSTFAHCMYDCCRVVGGSLRAENCVFTDGSMGAATAGGHADFVNCVFNGLTIAVRWANGTYANCIFSDIASTFMDSAGSDFSHCLYWNAPGFGPQSASLVGQNGNVWGDPCFVDPDGGDFHIQLGSAAVDMADGSVAPALDYYGQPRMDIETAEKLGEPAANGAIPDAGIHELMPRTTEADTDLALDTIELPQAGAVGGEITLAWTVQNVGAKAVDGSWRDALSLVNDGSGQEVPLGTFVVEGYIAPGGTKRTERTVIVPPLAEGAWRVKVVANAYRDVWEGALTSNNLLLSEETITLSVQTLSLGTTSWFFSAGGWQLWRIPAEAAGCSLTLTAPRGASVAYSVAPFGEQIATKHVTTFTASPGLAGGWLYVETPEMAQEVILALESRIELASLSPTWVEAKRQTLTLTLQGAGFTEQSQCSLLTEAGESIRADAVVCLSAGTLRATFTDITLAEEARYTPMVEEGSQRATLPAALLATNRVSADGIEAEISIPSAIRPGRLYEAALTFRNTSDVAVPAPIFKVVAQRGAILSLTADFAQQAESLVLVGIAAEGEAGVIAPGASGRLPFFFKGTDSGSPLISFSTMKPNSPFALNSRFSSAQAYIAAMSQAATALNSTSPTPIYDAERISVYAQLMADGLADGRLLAKLYDTELQAPAANLELSLVCEDNGTQRTVQSDAEGVLCVEDLPNGLYHLEGESVLACQPTAFSISGATELGDLLITPKPFVHGTVTEAATRRPITGAIVSATLPGGGRTATTDANGRYRLYLDEAGTFTLTVTAQAAFGQTTSREVTLAPEETCQTVDFALELGGILRGRVTGDLATLEPECLSLTTGTQQLRVAIQADGTFESEPLPAGTYQVNSGNRNRFRVVNAPVSATLTAGAATELELALVKAPAVAYDDLPVLAPGEPLPTKPNWPGINNPQWDFDGDGTVDSTDPTPSLSYPDIGTYTPTLTYTDDEGNTHTETLDPVRVLPTINEDDYPYQDNVKDFSGFSGDCVVQITETTVILEPVDEVFNDLAEGDIFLLPESQLPFLVTGTPTTLEEGNLCVPCQPAQPHQVRQIPTTVPDEVIIRSIPKRTWHIIQINETILDSEGPEASLFRVTAEGDLSASFSVNVSLSVSGKKYWKRTDEFEWTSGYEFLLRSENSIGCTLSAEAGLSIELLSDKLWDEWLIPIAGIPGLSLRVKPYPTLKVSGDSTAEVSVESGYNFEIRCNTFTGIDVLENRPYTERRLSVEEGIELMGGVGFDVSLILGLKKANLGLLGIDGSFGLGVRYSNNRPREEDRPYTATLTPIAGGSITVHLLTLEIGAFSGSLYTKDFSLNLAESLAGTLYRSPMPCIYYNSDGAGTVDFVASCSDPTRAEEIIARSWDFGDGTGVIPIGTFFTHVYDLASEQTDDAKAYKVSLRHTIDPPWWTFLPEHTRLQQRKVYPGTFAKEFDPELGIPLGADQSQVPQSCDPNEMNGPAGLGEQRLVKPGEWMTYTIYFENKSDATGAAQEVRVTEQLDDALDWSTFEVLDVVYRNQVESGLSGLANGSATSALAGTAYKVRSQVAFDAATGQVEWYLRILDESTVDQWPADAYAGILPPNNAAHEGEGHITYRVKLRDDLADGTRVSATASIVFDANEPIETDPAWWNTIASALDTVAFEQSAIVVEAAQGYAELIVNGGSERAATSVVLQRAGGSMVQGEDFYFPESITLTWAQGDRTPKHLYISFNPRAVSLGDKTLSFVLTDANGLLLESPKSCQITVKRHIPALTWPEAEAPSAVLSAWVTEAAARAFITDGPLTLAAGTSLAQLEQARELGIFPALEARSGGGADLAVDFTFTVGALLPLPEEDALTFNARIVVHQGSIATPYQPQLSFTLLGGCELDGSDWTPMTPTAIGTPTPLSDDEAIIPLRFAHPPVSTWFMRLKAN